jgi:glycosyltransferase involved in cell wall biosynthesis
VHERFTELGGAEAVVEQLHRIWPRAAVFAGLVDPETVPPGLAGADLRPSALQRLYRGGRTYAHLLPLLPGAFARLDLRGFDVVVTSHHAFANRVRPPAGVPVVSYTLTPARWIWKREMRTVEMGGTAGRAALAVFAATQRRPDAAAARRTRAIATISHSVRDRVRDWWGLDAEVIPPPVDIDRFTRDTAVPREDFFLLAGRLVPYKRPEVAVTAAQRAGARLVVVGDGRSRGAVEDAAGPGVTVLGRVGDDQLRDLYRRCRALVFPGEEDFGIVPVEAQACGAPVVARDVGGVLDSVVDGVTGTLYHVTAPASEVDDLATALRSFDGSAFDGAAIRAHAERFSPARFRDAMATVVERVRRHSPT